MPAIVKALLAWFSSQARDLPWRRTRDPYAIWISEIMLQQTRVAAVIPYWERWMKHLPTIEALARARQERIHRLWAGLGYYRRARNLHRAAQQIVRAARAGAPKAPVRFPSAFDEILALPGIGRYTAGAVASIAFGQPRPAVDGNVMRVLARLLAVEGNLCEKQTNSILWRHAEHLTQAAEPAGACGELNQALMELGSLICLPATPRCGACPVRRFCVAAREGRTNELPERAKRPKPQTKHFAAFICRQAGRYLARQRPAGVVNAHLWEFPNAEMPAGRTLASASRQALGGEFSLRPFGVVKHTITRYRITLRIFWAAPASGCKAARNGAGVWRTLDQLRALPFPSAHRRVLDKIAVLGEPAAVN